MPISPLAGKPADPSLLISVPQLVTVYYTRHPDPSVPAERVAFGTSGHRDSALDRRSMRRTFFIERAVILTRGRSLEPPLTELRKARMEEPAQRTAVAQGQEEIARIVKETIEALDSKRGVAEEHVRRQREEIVRALIESRGRVGGADGAAARLGINRTTLLSRMKKLGIDPKQFS